MPALQDQRSYDLFTPLTLTMLCFIFSEKKRLKNKESRDELLQEIELPELYKHCYVLVTSGSSGGIKKQGTKSAYF